MGAENLSSNTPDRINVMKKDLPLFFQVADALSSKLKDDKPLFGMFHFEELSPQPPTLPDGYVGFAWRGTGSLDHFRFVYNSVLVRRNIAIATAKDPSDVEVGITKAIDYFIGAITPKQPLF